ncbi:MAG TPA: metal-dependent hydrolase [Limnobacter sp.]|uniref:metal-dependent hydrolase n=1 Tax=Limnobacter sp. TaxID=2003368 RepID=UPI002EDB190F
MKPTNPDIQHPPVSVHQKGSSFPVRRMDFDFTGFDKHFVDHDPACSHVWTAFQSMFPEGEQFFVDAVRSAKPRVKDEALLREISAFIGQEAMHGKEHLAANAALKAQGVSVDAWDARIGSLRRFLNKRLGVRSRLAGTAAVEHYTAVFAEHILKRDDFTDRINDPTIKALIVWHAMEEAEHRAVAFDTHVAIGGKHRERVIAMTVVSLGIVPLVGAAMLSCMRQDRQLLNLRSWARFARLYFGPSGLFTRAIPDLLRFYRKDFHPKQAQLENDMQRWAKRLGFNPV